MSVAAAVDLLRAARCPWAFTGAGVSTASGLPDFRSPGGLWAEIDPMAVASRSAFERRPETFYTFYRQRLEVLARAEPNSAHAALAALERSGRLRGVITQNVDGLHQAAGSSVVIELHGNLREAVCVVCATIRPIAVIRAALDTGTMPRCPDCGGMFKPNVVLFEDLLPMQPWLAAERAARASDVMLVVGSSLQVFPAASLPDETLDAGGRLIIVNREPTPFDGRAAVVIQGEAARILPEIANELETSGAEATSAPAADAGRIREEPA